MAAKKIHQCKHHGYSHPYTVCKKCQHQYCFNYWKACPSCAERAKTAPPFRGENPVPLAKGTARKRKSNPDASFKSLPIGARFTFTSERDFPYSGIAKGPWIKTGARTYVLESEQAGTKYRVGSISATVVHEAALPERARKSNPRKRSITNRWGVVIHVGDSFKVRHARGEVEGPFIVKSLETSGEYVKAYGPRVIFEHGGSAAIDDLIVSPDSYKKNPRPRLGAKNPKRKSSATGKAPTKRLVTRRTKNLRKGYFPNPIGGLEAKQSADTISAVLRVAGFPHVNVRIMALGGEERATVFVTVSLDPREQWNNGIFENSRYGKFSVDHIGTVEHFSGHGLGRMRKTKAKTAAEAAKKIAAFLDKTRYAQNPAKEKRSFVVDQEQKGLWYQVGHFATKTAAVKFAHNVADKTGKRTRVVRTFASAHNYPVTK